MRNEFGTLLRHLRTERGRTLVDIADLLGVSVPYVSDVERGRRGPFREEMLLRIAELLNVEFERLADAAIRSKDVFELSPDASSAHRDVGASLARHWKALSPEALRRIDQVLCEEVHRDRK